jgi:hypothetical protein
MKEFEQEPWIDDGVRGERAGVSGPSDGGRAIAGEDGGGEVP